MVDSINYSHDHADGFTSEGTLTQDKLFDDFDVRRKLTVLSGEGVLPRGTALGKITVGAATAAAKAGGNTGDGTISAVTLAANAKRGVYSVRFTAATVFTVEDPDGFVLGINGATGSAWADDLGFTITAGSTPFVAGDGFDITVAAGSGKWRKSLAAATDGSQVVRAISLHAIDATSADAEVIAGRRGSCNGAAVTLGAGHTLASIDDACMDRGIVFETIIGG